jgi:hypothetical protein
VDGLEPGSISVSHVEGHARDGRSRKQEAGSRKQEAAYPFSRRCLAVGCSGRDTWRVSKLKHDARRGQDHSAGTVGEFEASGLTLREFCERRGVKFTSFRNWLCRLRGKICGQSDRKKRSSGFVEIVP